MLKLHSILILFFLTVFSSCAIGSSSVISSFEQGYAQGKKERDQANTLLQNVTTILAAASSLYQKNHSSADVSKENIQQLLTDQKDLFKTPWNTDIVISAQTKDSISVTILKTPKDICKMFMDGMRSVRYQLNSCNQNGPTDIKLIVTEIN